MTTHVGLSTGRIEELLRSLEDSDDSQVLTLAEYAERVSLTAEEFGAMLGEVIAVRKIAETGTGALVNFRGNSTAEGVAGIYKRIRFKFHVEIGTPKSTISTREIKEIAQRTIQFILSKVGGEFAQFEHEVAEEKQRAWERAEKAKTENLN
jgi:hypothetical protein